MKIYTTIKIDIDTGEILHEESFEWTGPVACCKGGGGNMVDRVYNARMADIAERQQSMAEDYFDFWQKEYKPFESAQIKANQEMLPYLTKQGIAEASAAQAQASVAEAQAQGLLQQGADGKTLLGLQQETERKTLEATQQKLGISRDLIGRQAEVARLAYDEAIRGTDPNRQANMAGADVAHSFASAGEQMRRDAARFGLNQNSAGFAAGMADLARERAKGIAGARTTARVNAEDQRFSRLTSAAGMGLGAV